MAMIVRAGRSGPADRSAFAMRSDDDIRPNASRLCDQLVKLSRKALAKLRKATRRGKAKVVLSVRAADPAGNRVTASRKVTVKR